MGIIKEISGNEIKIINGCIPFIKIKIPEEDIEEIKGEYKNEIVRNGEILNWNKEIYCIKNCNENKIMYDITNECKRLEINKNDLPKENIYEKDKCNIKLLKDECLNHIYIDFFNHNLAGEGEYWDINYIEENDEVCNNVCEYKYKDLPGNPCDCIVENVRIKGKKGIDECLN